MREHWMERADYVTDGDSRILGQDDDGDIYVPSRILRDRWDRPFNAWNPTHWQYWVRSRRTGRIAFLEADQ